jgi:hypothetical protein
MNERWKPVKGFSLYIISDWGKVKKLKRKVDFTKRESYVGGYYKWKGYTSKQRLVKPTVSKGVAKVGLRGDDGKRYWIQLKDLVADHWMRNRTGAVVQLKNKKDPANCRLGNLKEKGSKPLDRNTRLLESEVAEIKKKLREDDSRGRYARIAREYGVNKWTISLIDKGKIWDHVRSLD